MFDNWTKGTVSEKGRFLHGHNRGKCSPRTYPRGKERSGRGGWVPGPQRGLGTTSGVFGRFVICPDLGPFMIRETLSFLVSLPVRGL